MVWSCRCEGCSLSQWNPGWTKCPCFQHDTSRIPRSPLSNSQSGLNTLHKNARLNKTQTDKKLSQSLLISVSIELSYSLLILATQKAVLLRFQKDSSPKTSEQTAKSPYLCAGKCKASPDHDISQENSRNLHKTQTQTHTDKKRVIQHFCAMGNLLGITRKSSKMACKLPGFQLQIRSKAFHVPLSIRASSDCLHLCDFLSIDIKWTIC